MKASVSFRLGEQWQQVWSRSFSVAKLWKAMGRQPAPGLRSRDVLQAAIVAGIVGLLLKVFVVDFCRVPSASMSPTLIPGDYVVVSKLAYAIGVPPRLPLGVVLPAEWRWWYRLPQRWDVVVIDFPQVVGAAASDTVQYLIKRVVGLPGDTLRLSGDTLVINGTAYWLPGMQEPSASMVVPFRGMKLPLSAATASRWMPLLQRDGARVEIHSDTVYVNGAPSTTYTVCQDYVFVMGDNYRISWDSRHWGVVPRRAIVGKALLVYYSRAEDGRVRWNRIGHLLH